jgi:hypothetical protein
LHPAWREKPIVPDSSSDRPHPPKRDESVPAANCRAAVVSSGTSGKRPVPFRGCTPWRGCDVARLASQPRLRAPTWSFPFPMALQTARRLDTDSPIICRQFSSASLAQRTQRFAWACTSPIVVAEKPSRIASAASLPIARCDESLTFESWVSCGQCLSETMTEGIKADCITCNRCAVDWLEMDVSCKRWQLTDRLSNQVEIFSCHLRPPMQRNIALLS